MADENVGIEASRKEIDQAGKDRGLVVRDGQDVAGTHKGERQMRTPFQVLCMCRGPLYSGLTFQSG